MIAAVLSLLLAEAGVVSVFCRDASCACVNLSCTCGQVCDGNRPACFASTSSFCADDSECDAGCAPFVCRANRCVLPDGGSVPGGPAAGGESGGAVMTPSGCSCSSAPLLLVPFVAIAVWRARRRPRTG